MRSSATPCETCGHRADYHHQFEPMKCGRGECSCGQLETKSLRAHRACRIWRREDGVIVIPVAALLATGYTVLAKRAESLFPEGVPVTPEALSALGKESLAGIADLCAQLLPAAYRPNFQDAMQGARSVQVARQRNAIARAELWYQGKLFAAFLEALEASMEARP